MSPAKIWGVIEFYEKELAARGYPATQMTEAQYDEKYPGVYVLYCHSRWMMQHCLQVFKPAFEAAWAAVTAEIAPPVDAVVAARADLEKAMRWMCYVQGLANAVGLYSCNELRDHSRSGGGAVPPADSFKTAAEEHGKKAVPQTPATPATPPRPPGGYGASSDADWDAE